MAHGPMPSAPTSGGREVGAGDPASKRILEWIHKRIEKLEEEIDKLMELQTLIENYELVPRPGERPVMSVSVADLKVGAIFKGDNHLRAAFENPQEMPAEVREFLNTLDKMLKAQDEESRAYAKEKFNNLKRRLEEKVNEIEKLIYYEIPRVEIVDADSTVFEVVIDNVEPDNAELVEALELALRASYLMVNKDELIPLSLRTEQDEQDEVEESNGRA